MEIRILAPTGALGAGFRVESLERGVAMRPHVIACDAGSTDSRPYYLGSGEPKLAPAAVARVVLAGRASDTALYAALPHAMGADPGLTWHAAKTVECGAACAVPPSADGLFVHLWDDHFDVEPLDLSSRLTPHSVAAHT